MTERLFEDFSVGERFECGAVIADRDALLAARKPGRMGQAIP